MPIRLTHSAASPCGSPAPPIRRAQQRSRSGHTPTFASFATPLQACTPPVHGMSCADLCVAEEEARLQVSRSEMAEALVLLLLVAGAAAIPPAHTWVRTDLTSSSPSNRRRDDDASKLTTLWRRINAELAKLERRRECSAPCGQTEFDDASQAISWETNCMHETINAIPLQPKRKQILCEWSCDSQQEVSLDEDENARTLDDMKKLRLRTEGYLSTLVGEVNSALDVENADTENPTWEVRRPPHAHTRLRMRTAGCSARHLDATPANKAKTVSVHRWASCSRPTARQTSRASKRRPGRRSCRMTRGTASSTCATTCAPRFIVQSTLYACV